MKKIGLILFIALFSFSLSSGEGVKKESSQNKGDCPYLNSLQTSQTDKVECPYLKSKLEKAEVKAKSKEKCPYVEKQKADKTTKKFRHTLDRNIT